MAQYLGLSGRGDPARGWTLSDGLWLSPSALWGARLHLQGWPRLGHQERVRRPRGRRAAQDRDGDSGLQPHVAGQRQGQGRRDQLGASRRLSAYRLSQRAADADGTVVASYHEWSDDAKPIQFVLCTRFNV